MIQFSLDVIILLLITDYNKTLCAYNDQNSPRRRLSGVLLEQRTLMLRSVSEWERAHCAIVNFWVRREENSYEPRAASFQETSKEKQKGWVRVFSFALSSMFPHCNPWHSCTMWQSGIQAALSSPCILLCQYFAAFNAHRGQMHCCISNLVCFLASFLFFFFFFFAFSLCCRLRGVPVVGGARTLL